MSLLAALDTMTQQVNSLGKGAARVAERMDAYENWKVVVELNGENKTLNVIASDKNQAYREAARKASIEHGGNWKAISGVKYAHDAEEIKHGERKLYKGYWIIRHFEQYIIEKDGFRISTQRSLGAAKSDIDGLV